MNELLTAPPTARATEIVNEIAIVNETASEIGAETEKDLVTGPIATTAVTTTRAVTTSRTHGTIEPPSPARCKQVRRVQEVPADARSVLGYVRLRRDDGYRRERSHGRRRETYRARYTSHAGSLRTGSGSRVFCCRPRDLQTGIDTVATIAATITTGSGAIANEAVRPRPADGMVERTRTRGR
jgi:hypothetical protein